MPSQSKKNSYILNGIFQVKLKDSDGRICTFEFDEKYKTFTPILLQLEPIRTQIESVYKAYRRTARGLVGLMKKALSRRDTKIQTKLEKHTVDFLNLTPWVTPMSDRNKLKREILEEIIEFTLECIKNKQYITEEVRKKAMYSFLKCAVELFITDIDSFLYRVFHMNAAEISSDRLRQLRTTYVLYIIQSFFLSVIDKYIKKRPHLLQTRPGIIPCHILANLFEKVFKPVVNILSEMSDYEFSKSYHHEDTPEKLKFFKSDLISRHRHMIKLFQKMIPPSKPPTLRRPLSKSGQSKLRDWFSATGQLMRKDSKLYHDIAKGSISNPAKIIKSVDPTVHGLTKKEMERQAAKIKEAILKRQEDWKNSFTSTPQRSQKEPPLNYDQKSQQQYRDPVGMYPQN